MDGVKKAYTESLGWHLESIRANGGEIPEALQGEYELEFELNIQALLHYFDGIKIVIFITCSANVVQTGIKKALTKPL